MRAEVTKRIKHLGESGRAREAVSELAQMARLGVQPDTQAGTALLHACVRNRELDMAQTVFEELFGELPASTCSSQHQHHTPASYDHGVYAHQRILHAYMHALSLPSYKSLPGFSQSGSFANAIAREVAGVLFREVQRPDDSTCVIGRASSLFMCATGAYLQPDDVTFSILVKGYGECNPPRWLAISSLLNLMDNKYNMQPSTGVICVSVCS